ncbi:MAG: hypothetical protein LAT67_01630 [Balneolales bacterium]|nr:hypothetical protein [Balneolales bacterium]
MFTPLLKSALLFGLLPFIISLMPVQSFATGNGVSAHDSTKTIIPDTPKSAENAVRTTPNSWCLFWGLIGNGCPQTAKLATETAEKPDNSNERSLVAQEDSHQRSILWGAVKWRMSRSVTVYKEDAEVE